MILLDTNVLSALMRPRPDQEIIGWLDQQPRISVWTTSITVLEIRFGLQIMAAGKRRTALLSMFDRLLAEVFEHRVAHFDEAAAQQAADLVAVRQKKGRLIDLRASMIAGIALATRATLATRNVRHFQDAGCLVINPWEP